jgi:DNA gyrase subunit B
MKVYVERGSACKVRKSRYTLRNFERMYYSSQPLKLIDTTKATTAGRELFIVEGDSASGAVANVRNMQTQAVLPMQGKPMNALKASALRVGEYALFQQVAVALNLPLIDTETGEIALNLSRPNAFAQPAFERLILLFDPDADGIHAGALMLMFCLRWLRPLLADGRVLMVRPPLYVIRIDQSQEDYLAYSPDHADKLIAELKRRGATGVTSHRHRGLASIATALLRDSCVDPATRKADVMTIDDARLSAQMFGSLEQSL